MPLKRTAFFLWILPALLFSIPLAQGAEPAGHFTTMDGAIYYVTDGKAEIVNLDPLAREIVIHGTVDGARVSFGANGGRVFDGAASAETVVIEDGVKCIDYLRFEGLEKLKTVDVYCDTDLIGEMGRAAYLLDCPTVTSLSFHDQNKSENASKRITVEVRGCPEFSALFIQRQHSFCDLDIMSGNVTLTLPKSMEQVRIWSSSIEVKEIIIDPQNPYLEIIDGVLFSKETKKIIHYSRQKEEEHYDIPEGTVEATITSPYLKSIAIPESLEKISLYNTPLETITCSERNPHMKVVDNVLYSKDGDGTQLLYYPQANRAKAFVIPAGVDSFRIASDYLEHLSIAEGLEKVDYCTIDAKNLQTLTLPSTLENFPLDAGDHVPNLQAVHIADENPYMKSIDGCVYSSSGVALQYVPPGMEALVIAEGTKFFNPFDWGAYGFLGGENTKTIFFPASMLLEYDENCENEPFSYFYWRGYYVSHPMRAPQTYYVAESHPSVMAIDGMLLTKDRKTLIAVPLIQEEYFEIPVGIEHISTHAFPPNNTLKTIVVPEGVESIYHRAIAGQTALTTVSLPSTLECIDRGAFEDCLSLEKVVLPANIESLENFFSISDIQNFIWDRASPKPNITRLELVIPPNTVEFDGMFDGYSYLRRSANELIWSVEKGSAAYRYALKNRVPYRCIDDETDTSGAIYGMLIAASMADQAPVYEAMDEQSPHAMKKQGTIVFVAKQFADWTMIIDGREVGFVKNENLHVFDSPMNISYQAATAVDALPVYARPSEESKVIYTFPRDAEVPIISIAGPWLRVLVEDDTGFIRMDSENVCVFFVEGHWRISALAVTISEPFQAIPIYATPEKSDRVLRQCLPGEILQVIKAGTDWCMVCTGDYGTQNGFVQTELLTFLPSR
ncbi:MAG: leucine-rich repeat domain-containing protein [Firmicutes bacterium]|nr:leucine-rich repeat domain-containing protein [Bacillota bacterium]